LKDSLETTTKIIEVELDNFFEDFFRNINSVETIDIEVISDKIQEIIGKQSDMTRTETEYAIDRSRILLLKNLETSLIQNKFKETSKKLGQVHSKTSVSPSKKK